MIETIQHLISGGRSILLFFHVIMVSDDLQTKCILDSDWLYGIEQ